MKMDKLGEWAFLACVIIAVLAGIAAGAVAEYAGWITLALVVLGVIVGLLNVSEKETTAFLVAAIALIVAGGAGFSAINTVVGGLGTAIATILGNVAAFVAPAAVIVALKGIWAMAKK
jgi:hypothetical protein